MPTPVADAARDVAEHASSVARLEVELAALELKKKLGTLGVGLGLGAGAGLLGVYMGAFAFATLAAVLATFLPWWLSLLIVTALLGGLATLLALLARSSIRKASPPVPEQALQEARLTTEAIKR